MSPFHKSGNTKNGNLKEALNKGIGNTDFLNSPQDSEQQSQGKWELITFFDSFGVLSLMFRQ